MPKVLIKEYDGSKANSVASDNFAVLLPGYLGEPKTGYDRAKLLIDCDVYEIKTQKDFINYIGRLEGIQSNSQVAPVLNIINPTGTNNYEKCYRNLTINDFHVENTKVYAITEIEADDPFYGHLFGKNGHLLKTFEWEETVVTERDKLDADGAPVLGEDGQPEKEVVATEIVSRTATIKLSEVALGDVTLIQNSGMSITSSDKYCLITVGNEGKDQFEDEHRGNQIAYELLGLGYTVLYKALNPNQSLENQLCGEEGKNFWEPLKDKSVFNFRYVMTGGYYNPNAMNNIIDLATCINSNVSLEYSETLAGSENGRGDCIALCDIDEDRFGISSSLTMSQLATQFGNAAKAMTESPYAAIFAPRVSYAQYPAVDYNNDGEMEDILWPASFHYLACAARAFERYNEWYAVAGYNRGISKFDVTGTTVKVGEILVNTLAPRIDNGYTSKAINFVLHERGNYYLWGNRTAEKLKTNEGLKFHHFLNIRQLCCSIKKQLYTACRQFTFDPNSDLLWINFVNAIKPTLEAMKADQGIKGYTISRATSEAKAVLTAKIRIVPIEAVEDFDISIYLEDSLTGIVVNASEEQA